MKVQKLGETVFNHRLDFSGDVEVILKPRKVGHVPATFDVGEHYVVSIPFEDMKKLVLDSLRHKKIRELTEASDREIEQWILRNL